MSQILIHLFLKIYIELLEQLHQNITLNQLKNYNILRDQQQHMIEWRREEIESLGTIRETQKSMWDQLRDIEVGSGDKV